MLLQSNAVVTITRNSVALSGMSSIPAMVLPPVAQNISPEGVIVSTTVLLNPLPAGITLKAGDQMIFLSLGGHGGLSQAPKRNILSAPLAPVAPRLTRLAVVRVYIDGIIQ